MKKIYYLFLTFVLCAIAVSCTDSKIIDVKYKKQISSNKLYEVDIPVGYEQKGCDGYFMAFTNDRTNTFLVIDILNESLLKFAENQQNGANAKFSYQLISSSDSTRFFRVTNGSNVMWSAYEFYISKELDGNEYVVKLSSDNLSKDYLKSIIYHIQNSLSTHTSNTVKKEGDSKNSTKIKPFALRSTDYYSIEYPKEWVVLTDINEMTEAYIGSENKMLGLTISFFDTNSTLSELSEEQNSNIVELGATKLDDEYITINNELCYKCVYEFELNGNEVMQISYTIKKADTVFNILFGNHKKEVLNNLKLIDKIIKTFKIK